MEYVNKGFVTFAKNVLQGLSYSGFRISCGIGKVFDPLDDDGAAVMEINANIFADELGDNYPDITIIDENGLALIRLTNFNSRNVSMARKAWKFPVNDSSVAIRDVAEALKKFMKVSA